MDRVRYTFADFKKIIQELRSGHGCPWDRKQTHASLKPCLEEEVQEVLEGIDILDSTGDWENLCEELGDVLLQVMMHSVIAEEEGFFTIEDVIQGVSEKMVRRHPHVFGGNSENTADGRYLSWEEIKKMEKSESDRYAVEIRT